MALADDGPPEGLEPRAPTLADLRDLCRALNEHGAKYIVTGGFAIHAAGYNRNTMDVDLIVATDADNERRVFEALATLPDQAVRELKPGEIDQYVVVRVADEIVVALMKTAGGDRLRRCGRRRGRPCGGWCADPIRVTPLVVADEVDDPSREGRSRPRVSSVLVC